MGRWIVLAGSSGKSTTPSAGTLRVRLPFLDQLLSFGPLFCCQDGGDLGLRVGHRGTNLLMKCRSACLILGREGSLKSLLTKLLQFFADSFNAGEGLVDVTLQTRE